MNNNDSIERKILYRIADEIVSLEQKGEIIIFNAENVNPVYFPDGGKQISAIISTLKNEQAFTPESAAKICPPEIFHFLAKHNIIIKKNQNSQDQDNKNICRKCESTFKAQGRSMYLLLSHSCNQKCIYCLNGRETYGAGNGIIMTEDVALKSVKTVLESISDTGSLEIVFFGGEPMINWNLAKTIIHFCEEVLRLESPWKKIKYHLTTNLTLFPEDLVEYALKYNISFLVNIDGPAEIHDKTRPFTGGGGSFYTTVRNISKLKDAGLQVALRATITKYNQEKMLRIAEIHKEIGGSSSAFVPLNAINSDEEILPLDMCPEPQVFSDGLTAVFNSGIWKTEQLYPFNEYAGRLVPGYRNIWSCGAPHANTPVITASGEIFSCIYLVGINRYRIGHIDNNDFPVASVINDMLEITNINNSEICVNCGFRYLCGGGCPVGRFSVTGNPNASQEIKDYTRDISCTVSKTVLKLLLWDRASKRKDTYFRNVVNQCI